MCGTTYIEPLDESVKQTEAEASATSQGKAILRISGDSIHIRAKDRYEVITHGFLCGGIIFNSQGNHPLYIEYNGANTVPNCNQIICTPKEFIPDEEWTTTKSLDWNDCLCITNGRYECAIDIDSDFSIDKLQYDCICPVVVRVGGKAYRYAKPILQDIIYKGRKYPVLPIRKNYPITNDIKRILHGDGVSNVLSGL